MIKRFLRWRERRRRLRLRDLYLGGTREPVERQPDPREERRQRLRKMLIENIRYLPPRQ